MLPEEEYDNYSIVVQNYENLVDTVLSSESEIFLIELTHQPRIKLNQALKIQANALGIHNITYSQIVKMPVIIGKRIHEMNTEIYKSVESIVLLYWNTADTSFSSLNAMIAQELIERIDDYDLLNRVKQDILAYDSTSPFLSSWVKHWITSFFSNRIVLNHDEEQIEYNFLRQHVSNIKADLLLNLHAQFMDLYTKIQDGIIIDDNDT
ncbi:unnamed protein product [Rhizopus microsporus]|nr:hypothetical protein BCV71DRAFT_101458 [Rhizopus microsporus]CEJ01579.1 hypothetical protein RMCBS344292_15602 [Rhizopus microsporus]